MKHSLREMTRLERMIVLKPHVEHFKVALLEQRQWYADMERSLLKGAQIRAKEHQDQLNENCTAAFFALEKNLGPSSLTANL